MSDVTERIGRARRAGRVQRFHCYEMVHREDVAQHTFNVMNLLMILCDGVVSPELMTAALLHDQGEYVTGDIPSPVKRLLGGKLDEMENAAINMIHKRGIPELTEWQHLMLKAADNLDGLLTCVREIRRGNVLMREVGDTYVKYLKELSPKLGGGQAGEIVRHYVNCWENM